MARKAHSFDPLDADRKILANAMNNQREALAILKEVFGASILDSKIRPAESLQRIATLARNLGRNIQDLERVTVIPKPKSRQPQFKPKRRGAQGTTRVRS